MWTLMGRASHLWCIAIRRFSVHNFAASHLRPFKDFACARHSLPLGF